MRLIDVIRKYFIRSENLEILRELHCITSNINKNKYWQYEMKGFLYALKSTGYLHPDSVSDILNEIFPKEDVGLRNRARSKAFSIDVFAYDASNDVRKYQFNVPARNPVDAYAKLSQRVFYDQLPNVKIVQVFEGTKKERAQDQAFVRIFQNDEIVAPSHPRPVDVEMI